MKYCTGIQILTFKETLGKRAEGYFSLAVNDA